MSLARWLSTVGLVVGLAAMGEIVETPGERGFYWAAERTIELQASALPARRRVLLKSVYLFLAKRANDLGVCWPGYGAIAKGVGCDRSTAIKAVKWLRQHDWILVLNRQRADGWASWEGWRYTSNVYWVRLEGPDGLSEADWARAVYRDGEDFFTDSEAQIVDDQGDEIVDEEGFEDAGGAADAPDEIDAAIREAQARLDRERERLRRSAPRVVELPPQVRNSIAPPSMQPPRASEGDPFFVAFREIFEAARREVYQDEVHGKIRREGRDAIAAIVQGLCGEAYAWAQQRQIEVDFGALRSDLCARLAIAWLGRPGTDGYLRQKRHPIALIVGDLPRLASEVLDAWKAEQRAPRHPAPAPPRPPPATDSGPWAPPAPPQHKPKGPVRLVSMAEMNADVDAWGGCPAPGPDPPEEG